jgi:hypothetical protein
VIAGVKHPATNLGHLLAAVIIIALNIHNNAGHFRLNDVCMRPCLPCHFTGIEISRRKCFGLNV